MHSMIVEGLTMPAALKEKLKSILAPKGQRERRLPFRNPQRSWDHLR